jgi:hypothetical protein
MIASTPSCDCACADHLHAAFVALLPRIELHARFHFRAVHCAEKRAELIAEATALAWKWFLRLVQRGKNVNEFPSTFASLVARAVRSGRRLCGNEKARDVLSTVAKRRHGFAVESLPASTARSRDGFCSTPHGQGMPDIFEERLRDNTVTPIPDAAAFRIDWPRFLATLSDRDRRLAEYLSLGHAAKKAARKFKLSPPRVTQLRQRWSREWQLFQGAESLAA